MKRNFVLVLVFFLMTSIGSAQVFNTGTTLRPKQFSIGLNPVFWNGDFGFFMHGGVGIKSGIDFGVHYGAIAGGDYIGADFEWQFMSGKPALSLATGAHVIGSTFGFDGSLNVSFPIRGDAAIYTGIDSDINFAEPETSLLLWFPLGIELAVQNNFAIILEGEVGLVDAAYHVFGGGVVFYF